MTVAVAVDNSEREEPVRRRVPLKAIVLDADLQPRAKIDRDTVERYAELLRDGVAFPPVVLVFDGEKFWLADGFHRVYGHDEAGLTACEAVIQAGSKLDAARIALKANAEHGRPRTEKDIDRAYKTAMTFKLVDPTDWRGVMAAIACSSGKAQELTRAAREAQEAEQRRRMFEMHRQGDSNRAIAAELGCDEKTVRNFLEALRKAREARAEIPQRGKNPQAVDHDPDTGEARVTAGADGLPQAEMFDEDEEGGPPPALDPVALYEEERRREARQREMWGEVLGVLQSFAKLPEPDTLYAHRYRKFDHALKPALDAAWDWMAAFEEKWDGASAQDS